METLASTLDGKRLPLPELADRCLGVDGTPTDEARFEAAHAQLDAALPRGGALVDRLRAWQNAHALPEQHRDRLPELVASAVAETRERVRDRIPFPDDASIDVVLDPGPHRGHHHSGPHGTVFINNSQPFNLADLIYVVAHEACPGHIAESMIKEQHLVEQRGMAEHRVRLMLSPAFVISEGIGLHAPGIAFPGDTAQAWLTDRVLGPLGIPADGSDFAAIHAARNELWGVWSNAALMKDAGASAVEVASYLRRWALLSEPEVEWALSFLSTSAMNAYVLSYHHGWQLLSAWLDVPDATSRFRRLLTEPLLPADLG